jgi:putative hydrolase of the HAD superfamily
VATLRAVNLEAVVFDWGGTLSLPLGDELADRWRAAAARLDPDRADEVAARLVAVEQAVWRRTTTTQRSATLAEIIATASTELGLDVAEAVRDQAAVSQLDAWTPHIAHDPDAAGVLAALRDRVLRLGLLSNTHWPRDFHERFLGRDGLADLLDARLYTSELAVTKPHPAAFRAALDALAVRSPAAAVFVGDRPLDDVRGAQHAGLRAVLRLVPGLPPGPVRPDATITRLGDLLPLVDGWRRG